MSSEVSTKPSCLDVEIDSSNMLTDEDESDAVAVVELQQI